MDDARDTSCASGTSLPEVHGFLPRGNALVGTFLHAPLAGNAGSKWVREELVLGDQHLRRKELRQNPFTGNFHSGLLRRGMPGLHGSASLSDLSLLKMEHVKKRQRLRGPADSAPVGSLDTISSASLTDDEFVSSDEDAVVRDLVQSSSETDDEDVDLYVEVGAFGWADRKEASPRGRSIVGTSLASSSLSSNGSNGAKATTPRAHQIKNNLSSDAVLVRTRSTSMSELKRVKSHHAGDLMRGIVSRLRSQTLDFAWKGLSYPTKRFHHRHSSTDEKSSSSEDDLRSFDESGAQDMEGNPWIIDRRNEITEKYKIDVSQSGRLGKGAYSVVQIAESRATGSLRAVKIVRKRLLVSNDEKEMVRNEVEIHQVLQHRHVIRLFATYEDPKRLFLVLEHVCGGTLENLLARSGGKVAECDALVISKQLMSALDYLHSHGVLQGDLKPANVLLEKDPILSTDVSQVGNLAPSERICVKICDFGLSRKVPDVRYYKETGDVHKVPYRSLIGTMGYVAPEILRKEPYTIAVDIWASGIIIYEMLSGIRPFVPYLDCVERDLEFPDPVFGMVSSSAVDFVSCLLRKEPSDRIRACDALHHPWIESSMRALLLGTEELFSTRNE